MTATFDSRTGHDPNSQKMTRRVFAVAAAAAAAVFVIARARQPAGTEASIAVHGTPGTVTLVEFTDDGARIGASQVAKVVRTDGEWYRQLGANSFRIARQADTEIPGFSAMLKEHRAGVYRCLCCATALFESSAKYESHTGWPSFWAPIAEENILKVMDTSLGFERTEVQCRRCEAHLGHVFNDGPQPTGLRFCMNAASLKFAARLPAKG